MGGQMSMEGALGKESSTALWRESESERGREGPACATTVRAGRSQGQGADWGQVHAPAERHEQPVREGVRPN